MHRTLLCLQITPPTTFDIPPTTSDELKSKAPKVWWSNALFFCSVHALAAVGVYYRPPWDTPRATLLLCFLTWQLACFGITIGYHRMWSHRAFRGNYILRMVLALMGASATQGSIKWWSLRHRLHHRYTDDPVHDPYAATRGLWWSHMGWIFFKPNYERMELVDRQDLDHDPVVRFQHKYYLPLVLFSGFALPTIIAAMWDDTLGGYIYGALISRIMTWHCTFFVNSLAHWDGLQPFSDENTSRTNLIIALLTCGEGNHNFHHAFPQDFRAGPSSLDWDPSKWIIMALHRLGVVTGLRRARESDMKAAREHMAKKNGHHHHHHGALADEQETEWVGEVWDRQRALAYIRDAPKGSCLLLVDGFLIDATSYMGEHPGGAMLLRDYSIRTPVDKTDDWRDATWAFDGGLNNHSRAAKTRLRELRVAKLVI